MQLNMDTRHKYTIGWANWMNVLCINVCVLTIIATVIIGWILMLIAIKQQAATVLRPND